MRLTCYYKATDWSQVLVTLTSHSGDAAEGRSCTNHGVESRSHTRVSTVAHLGKYSVRLIMTVHMHTHYYFNNHLPGLSPLNGGLPRVSRKIPRNYYTGIFVQGECQSIESKFLISIKLEACSCLSERNWYRFHQSKCTEFH